MFDFYISGIEDWHTLIHVCWRWRNVVFSSPRRLNLQLLCTPRRPVTEMLNIWPELPIHVSYHGDLRLEAAEGTDNVTAALKLKGSISRISLRIDSCSAVWENIAAVMQDQDPFPILRYLDLHLWSSGEMIPVISDSFLGGSAPRLKHLFLHGILFPALPNLLLSATNLVILWLSDIPHSVYISPEAMVTYISVLTRLKTLSLRFRSPRSRPDRAGRFLHPSSRTLLPALTFFGFKGATEYLEDLVSRIDVPLLESSDMTFFHQILFDIVQFPNLASHMEMFTGLGRADVVLLGYYINITLSPKGGTVDSIKLKLEIPCTELDWQLSTLAQVYNLCLGTLSSLECLSICDHRYSPPRWQDDMENTQWLELLDPFAAVKDLYLSQEVSLHVASALKELSEERLTEVLPALQDIFIDDLQPFGFIQEAFRDFVAMRRRQVSGLPVAIHRWIREEEKLE